ncbi:F-box protein At5g07670-like [Asparagus officinalis]|uniref:F-box protein At5g07670-like n=1 Tax=Asparagus officinalis TaxID=4686 RepID=UPI00098E00DD|nr:F-box protein At5g07670-like [Asparagus officinalis]
MDAFHGDDESEEFTTGHFEKRLGSVHLQLMTLHEVEHCPQVFNMVIFVAAFNDQIINVTFDGLSEMFLENLRHRSLVRSSYVLQAKGHDCVAEDTKRCSEGESSSAARPNPNPRSPKISFPFPLQLPHPISLRFPLAVPLSHRADGHRLLSTSSILLILSEIPLPLLETPLSRCPSLTWLVSGRLRRIPSYPIRRWPSLPRLLSRFPNLTDLNLVPAVFSSSDSRPLHCSGQVVLSRGNVSIQMDQVSFPTVGDCPFIDSDSIDRGLETVARGCPNLRRLSVAGTKSGLFPVSDACDTLQEMELHCCTDLALRSVSGFRNLQILKLVGSVEGLYSGPGVSDIGLTILAHGCKRLVKLELSGCEGSYDGISAIGRCCLMLEELTLSDNRMDAGWMAGLSFCRNLKTLKLQSCRKVDEDPGPLEHLGSCRTIERVQIQRCQLRDRKSLKALFTMCESAREIMFHNCWGLDDEMFGVARICRRVKLLSLEGCSQLTTEGLESVVLLWTDLKSLTVVSCNNVRDDAVSPALSNLFTVLKEFKWRPDSRSVLAMSLAGTGMGKKGGRFFNRV